MAASDWVLASRNRGKLDELQQLLAPLGCRLHLISEFSDEAPDEPAPSFVENAILKARHAARASGLPAIADDSGLEVAALGGAPGVRSARYAGEHASDADNNAKLLAAMAAVPDGQRQANFVSLVVALRHAEDPRPLIAEGVWPGSILRAPRGAGGFGYDPLFYVAEHGCAAAELPPAVKNRISHRGQAIARLQALLRDVRH